MAKVPLSERDPEILRILRYFDYEHLPEELQLISKWSKILAHQMVRDLPDGEELKYGLRKLLEAKDCFVRANIDRLSEEE